MSQEPEIVRLAKLVRLMRSAQTRYFRGDKSRASMSAALDLEKRVDTAVAWVIGNRQRDLFPGGPSRPGAYRGDRGDTSKGSR
jgi:hypothetical protein